MKKYIIILPFLLNILCGQDVNELLRKTGLSKTEAEKMLKARGGGIESKAQSDFDNSDNLNIDELNDQIKKDIEQKNSFEKSNNDSKKFLPDAENDLASSEKESDSENDIEKKELKDSEPDVPYFGYNVFKKDPEVFQQSLDNNIDPNYSIGPGDEVIIMLWGQTESYETFVVSKEGYLFIPNVGQVFVNGLTLSKLEDKLLKILKKVYSSLSSNSGKGATFLDVSLGSLVLRPLRIFALGDLIQPGAYAVKPSTTLFTSLYYFNGPTTNGSLRNIKLIRDDKEIATIDFYDFLLTGKKNNDIQIQRDDVVFIPPRGKTVKVYGEVNRQSIYELKEKEGLSSLIKIFGGLKATTYMRRVKIERILPPEQRIELDMDRTIIDFNLQELIDSKDDLPLLDGDIITFSKIFDDVDNFVRITGAVERPGSYDLGKGLKVNELINKASGLLGDAYLKEAVILRVNEDNTQNHISIDLLSSLEMDESNNIPLKSEDILTIYSNSEMLHSSDLEISGHVKNPGSLTFRNGMTVYDLVFFGGGFEDEDHLKNTFFERADLVRVNDDNFSKTLVSFRLDSVLIGKGLANEKLKMGDRIIIYSKKDINGFYDKSVSLTGHVKIDGEFELFEGMRISDLLFVGGGIKDEFHLKNMFLDRADLVRFEDDQISKKIIKVNIGSIIDSPGSRIDLELQNEDILRVYSKVIFNQFKTVSIKGIINTPGSYELKENMTVKDLILEAGGVSSDIYKYRVDIARINPKNKNENEFSKIFTYNMNNDFSVFNIGNKQKLDSKIILSPFDQVTIRPDPFFYEQRNVTIDGLVYYPGEYALTGPEEKVSDLIERAGGLRPEAYPLASSLIRNGQKVNLSFTQIIKNPRSKSNFSLFSGDSIIIGSRTNLVSIEGEVNSPGNYQYIKGNRLKDYIDIAGGYTIDASKNQTFITYPDGTSNRNEFLNFSPKVEDGSVIIVPAKEVAEPFNFTEYVTNWTAIWADITQAYLLIVLAVQGSSN